ncbi:hypothetical protein ECT23400_2232 [Escherichia coli T234_00]|nr:hypothetical protein ECT23400_2232 [Escherichia coli T234_00]
MFASLNAAADDSVFTVMDDPASAKKPFEGNLNAGYLAQSGNTKSSSLTADTTMTWYGQTTAWSLWGNASNTSSNDERSSEKYAAGGRSRFNLTDYDYLFGQASWLTDRYNGYRERDVLTAGYGRQFLNGRYTVSALNSVQVCVTTNIPTMPVKLSRWAMPPVLMHGSLLTTLNLRRVFPSLARKTQR